jgi:hypothetical protein
MLVTGLVRLFLIGLVASFWLSIWLSLAVVEVAVILHKTAVVLEVCSLVRFP